MSVCKVIAGSLTEWERRGKGEWGKGTSTVREEMERRRRGWKERGTKDKKSRKSRIKAR